MAFVFHSSFGGFQDFVMVLFRRGTMGRLVLCSYSPSFFSVLNFYLSVHICTISLLQFGLFNIMEIGASVLGTISF